MKTFAWICLIIFIVLAEYIVVRGINPPDVYTIESRWHIYYENGEWKHTDYGGEYSKNGVFLKYLEQDEVK